MHPAIRGTIHDLIRDEQWTPDELAAQLRAHAEVGLSRVQLWIEPNTVAGYEAFAPVLEALDRG